MIMKTLTANKNQDKNKTRYWLSVLTIILGIPIGVLLWQWVHANEVQDQKYKAGTVKWNECEKRCASFGISQDSLIGPALERDIHSRSTFDYLFVWHSDKPNVILEINVIKNRDYTVKINHKWILNGKSLDN